MMIVYSIACIYTISPLTIHRKLSADNESINLIAFTDPSVYKLISFIRAYIIYIYIYIYIY